MSARLVRMLTVLGPTGGTPTEDLYIAATLLTAAGSIPYASAARTPAELAIGTAGGHLISDGTSPVYSTPRDRLLMPTGAITETYPRHLQTINMASVLTSGRLLLVAVALHKGQVVTNQNWFSGSTALVTGTNQWAALFDASRVKLAISADATNAAWGTDTKKTFAMTVPYTATASGLYYLGLMVAATTVPTLAGNNPGQTQAANTEPPILLGTADSSLTNPASCPSTAAALTATFKMPYVYVT